MQLNEKHYECINLLIKGYKITEIANRLPASRTAIYNWLDDNEFKAELNKQRQEIKSAGKALIDSKVDTYIQRLEKLSREGDSEKTRLDATALLLAYGIGKPANKNINIEQTEDKKANVEDIDSLLEEYNDNVINLKEVKAN